MELLSREEITSAWRALSADSARHGWLSIPIVRNGPLKLNAARLHPDNEEALLVGFRSIPAPNSNIFPDGMGFRVERAFPDENHDSETWIALVKKQGGSLELFSLMVFDIVSALCADNSMRESQLFQIYLGRIRAWQEFMKKGRTGLSPESELGLVGELACLEKLMDAGLPARTTLDSWQGPLKGLHDFELGFGALEVKSTLAIDGFPAKVMSLEQLDDSERAPLFVCASRFSIEPEGQSLPMRIDRLLSVLSDEPSLQSDLIINLLHAGFLREHSGKYTRCFILRDTDFFLVDDTFPRLTPATVPAGVTSARYDIELQSRDREGVSIREVLTRVGMGDGYN